MIDTDKIEWEYTKSPPYTGWIKDTEARILVDNLFTDVDNLLAEVKRFRQMCLDERLCYDCLSDLYIAGLSDENPVDAYWCGMCAEPMKGLIE